MFVLSLNYYLSLPLGPSDNIYIFLSMSKLSFEGLKIFKKCRFKTWMGFVGQIMIKLETSFIEVFFSCPFDVLLAVAYAYMLMDTQWRLKRAPHLPECVVWRSGSSSELFTLCCYYETYVVTLDFSRAKWLQHAWLLYVYEEDRHTTRLRRDLSDRIPVPEWHMFGALLSVHWAGRWRQTYR